VAPVSSGRAVDGDCEQHRVTRSVSVGTSASSTTLDVLLFVLLVGAAIGVLVTAQSDAATERTTVAEETADVLSTSTTHATYSQSYAVTHEALLGVAGPRDVRVDRTVGGTHAELLAAATVATPTVAGTTLAPGDGALERAVRAVTARALPTRAHNVQVRARWRPYERSEPGGTLVVGDSPPRDADLSVATMTLPSGFPNVTAEAVESARASGYDGVATVVANGLLRGLFPPTETRSALHSEGPELVAVVARYRHASDQLGVETEGLLERRAVRAANERLADALAERVRDDLARSFDSPTAAARAVRVDSVQLVVRAWSP